ncbi:SusC/RagA family TonB-linked outer membrane protein [Labilibaculum sp.]|uniref:SusC/RagA family TonB-linked outer membrane protein n=1 Tax=Labilibaculum sp. TaxID=2060723 RepID=UPI002AA770AA|nr:SusC/RagA family TonB-linked outer membrane protein [Labilibaculum sp.]
MKKKLTHLIPNWDRAKTRQWLMRLTVLKMILLMSLLTTYARVNSQMIISNLKLEEVELSDALERIEELTDYDFVFSYNDVKGYLVSVDLESSTLEECLHEVLKGLPFEYTTKEDLVIVSYKKANPKPIQKEKKQINGKVTDERGVSLPGVSVVVKGTTYGISTDIDGNYSLEFSGNNGVLVFSFVGMQTREIFVNDQSVINAVLIENQSQLGEVVVTGYQTISRERSAGSFEIVNGESLQEKAKVRGSVLDGLEGLAAGLSVNMSSEGDKYLIRGTNSINSNRSPLFVVDGVSVPLDMVEGMLNANDIKSVSLLKDATAASIWGSRAANGVVVITTKNGVRNEKLKISYNGSYSFKGMPDYSYMDQMDSKMFIRTAAEIFNPETYTSDIVNNSTYGGNIYFPNIYPHELPLYRYYNSEISLAERDAALEKLASRNGRKEYEKNFMSNSYLTNQSVSFSGGNNNHDFYVSLGYQGEQGSLKNKTDEFKVNIRENINVAKWMKLDLTLNTSYSKDDSHLFSETWDQSTNYLTNLPYAAFHDTEGNPLSFSRYIMNENIQDQAEALSGQNLDYFPIDDYNKSTNEATGRNLRASVGVTIDLFKGLKYEGRFQYYSSDSNSEQYYPSETFGVRLERAYGTAMDGTVYLPRGGHFTMQDGYTDSYTIRNQFSYDNMLGEKHQITALLGSEISQNKIGSHTSFQRGYDKQTMQGIFYNDYVLNVDGVENPVLDQIPGQGINSFEPNTNTQAEVLLRYTSFYSNAAYTYNDKYSLNASIRVDQSNLFGSDPSLNFKPIWSLGTAWNMAKEDFMKNINSVNNLNVRLSYGFSGNSPDPGLGGPFNIIAAQTDPAYSEFGLGYQVSTPSNDKLTWEKTRTWNFGLDFSMFKNRFSGTIDVYDKKTTDLLAYNPINPTIGYTSVLSNVGTLTNKGFEVSLRNQNIASADFSWETNLVLSYNKNKLSKMYVEPPSSPYNKIDQTYSEGNPIGALFAYRWAGLDGQNGSPAVYNSQGDIVSSVEDIDTESAVPYQGTTVAPWYGSLSNLFQYKNFELSFMFIYNLGNKMRNDVNNQFTYRLTESVHKDFDKRWRKPGDELITNVPAYYDQNNADINETDIGYLYRYADINILDASYIKLRDLSLSYNFPQKVCHSIRAERIKFGVQVTNLLTIAFNGEGIDPEAFYLSSGARSERFGPSFSANLSIDF